MRPWAGAARVAAIAIFATAVGALLFGYKYLDHVARGYPLNWVIPLVEELTAAYGAVLLLFGAVLPLARRFPAERRLSTRALAAHALGVVAFSAAHTCFNWISRSVVFATLGYNYDYGRMPARFAMELPMDFIVYSVFVAGWLLLDRQRRARLRELEATRLEGRALEAELRNLRGQLEPHFLFNALNTISSVMYDDPAAADEMIGHLSDLMRASLRSGDSHEVPLAIEVEGVSHYVALLRARFGDRLQVTIGLEPGAERALVPPFVLQPLVENAVRHGSAAQGKPATIGITCRRKGSALDIMVHDDGPGVAGSVDPFAQGIGLGATRDRLRLLYGDNQHIEATTSGAGGFTVSISIPFHVDSGMAAELPPAAVGASKWR